MNYFESVIYICQLKRLEFYTNGYLYRLETLYKLMYGIRQPVASQGESEKR